MTVSPEKRSHPRVKDRLTLRSTSPAEGASEMSTTDLSLGGAQVAASRFVPLMTRVEVTLLLPPEEGTESGPRPVRAEAVVVRVNPPAPQAEIEHYQIALFFSRMEQRDRNALARYLSSQSREF
ncbi:MAG: PilZ domain-containing protein [Acidobacteria bacterium]|nr:PilZ domain-containing protein [Acidobacteriota bacterium]